MKRITGGILFIPLFITMGCNRYPSVCSYTISNDSITVVTRIAFGSCSRENEDQPILRTIADKNADMFIYLGDNIYGDTKNMQILRGKYNLLGCKPEFQYLMAAQPVFATWDDHDYGKNDAGKEYPRKDDSKKVFLEFWQEPKNSERWNHPGIYTSCMFGDTAHRVQLILLDNRTFRTSLKSNKEGYIPNDDTDATILGDEQWKWLQQELLKPAKLRFIATSTQFGVSHNYMESWANFPLEQAKMFQLIRSTQANGVIFMSGDVHYAELSCRREQGLYPIYDFTSSGLTRVDEVVAPNEHRIKEAIRERNFGMIEISWDPEHPTVKFIIYNEAGKERFSYIISVDELQL